MSDTDIASLTRGIFKYQNTWEISDMTYWAKLAFSFMRPVFDEDRKDWEETSKTNSRNAKERWDKMRNNTNISEPMRPHPTASEPMRASTDSVSGIDSVIDIDTDIIETDTVASQPNEYLLSIDYLKSYSLETEIPDYAEKYRDEWIKFCIFWGEKWRTGKIRAEWEKTFEIKKRFATWMSRKKEQYQQKSIPKESALDITL